MNELATHLNDSIKKYNPHVFNFLSNLGKKLYKPKGILSQSAEATKKATLEELIQIELAFNKTKFAEYTVQSTSYVSIVELSNYLPKGEDPYSKPEIRQRLFPKIPNTDYFCFYPMNKLRSGSDNWYMLSTGERKPMMRSHSLIGRKYAGKVKQIILGSVGFDDYEWGVALFAQDPLQFKKLIYEMRFDEVSARFGEFGSFFVGKFVSKEHFNHLLQL